MGDKLSLKIYELAKKDLEQIFKYISIELCNNRAALLLINKFENALIKVCEFPNSCPIILNKNIKENNVRKLLVENYNVFYRVKYNEVQVIRVLHKKRNTKKIIEKVYS